MANNGAKPGTISNPGTGATTGVTERYIDERFQSLDRAMAGLANSIKQLDEHMKTLVSVVVRQEEQAKNLVEICSTLDGLEKRTRDNELALATSSGTKTGSLAVLQWLTGGSFLAVVTLIWLMTRGGA